MYTVERLRKKLSPLEDRKLTEEILPLMQLEKLEKFERQYKGKRCVVLSPSAAWELLFPDVEPTLRDLTRLGRSLQGLLWERSYMQGNLIFTKPIQEIMDDGF